jgi:hypothetical protein
MKKLLLTVLLTTFSFSDIKVVESKSVEYGKEIPQQSKLISPGAYHNIEIVCIEGYKFVIVNNTNAVAVTQIKAGSSDYPMKCQD